MSLSVGIVGLPNVGKSTLFNALLQKQAALVANYPFATIEPNVGVVEVPDPRLGRLAEVVRDSGHARMTTRPPLVPAHYPPIKYAEVRFVDIAGLVKGASVGEGLGNKFLAHIRETDAICHVLRNFQDENVARSGSVDPAADLEVIRTELGLADLVTLEKQKPPKGKADKIEEQRWSGVQKLLQMVMAGKMANQAKLTDEEEITTQDLFLLTAKPELFILNSDEGDLVRSEEIAAEFAVKAEADPQQVVVICAKTEAELAELSGEEKREYLQSLGLAEPGLERLIKAAYKTLNLQSFLTAGEKEVRAWTIKQGMKAPEAAGVIHTDFAKNFIKAKVCSYDDFVSLGGWQPAAEAGKVRMEGRDYVMLEGDVVEFMVGKG